MQQGGPVMYMLLVCSIIVVAIVFERLFFFARQHGDTKGLLQQIGARIAADDLPGAIKICQNNKGMLPRILEFGLQRGEKNRADITDALSIALMEHLNALERFLGVIGTIAVIAPFIGLSGTVLGIIRAFQDIALKGNSTPAVVAGGVTSAARIMKIMSSTSNTSVNGVMLISAMTSASCCAESSDIVSAPNYFDFEGWYRSVGIGAPVLWK
ncbi:MAG TPA: MotA/TolQ/ExbB proton channel family protein, partial [Candidatus Acidoferrales bacterium]|nr:MotA/TolQ/ExbB proton channel family protein [Candidatus Acidoferrales bacterium]